MALLTLETDLEGKKAYFGQMRKLLQPLGFTLCGNWDYHRGKFDIALWREAGDTIYLRLPFYVVAGELDENSAYIEFMKPYVVKHVVNLGIDRDENSLLSATGFNQFQKPLDTDANIIHENHWENVGLQAINQVMDTVGNTGHLI